jgi:hypothetical protein
MLLITGTIRLPPESLQDALPAMRAMIDAQPRRKWLPCL